MSDDWAELLLEFIEVLVHQIVCLRQVYRADVFERQRLYGVAVKRSRHPQLNEYIHEVVAGLKPALRQGSLSQVAVALLRPDSTLAERYVVEPRLLASPTGAPVAELTAEALAEAEASLRGALMKLQYIDAYLGPPPRHCTFELVAHAATRGALPTDSWVEEQQEQHAARGSDDDGGGGCSARQGTCAAAGSGARPLAAADVVPIKTCSVAGAFALQFYVEAGK